MNNLADCLRCEFEGSAGQVSWNDPGLYRSNLAIWDEKAGLIEGVLDEQLKPAEGYLKHLKDLRERLAELAQRLPDIEQDIRT